MNVADRRENGKSVLSPRKNLFAPSALWWHETLLEDSAPQEPNVTAVMEDAKKVKHIVF